MITDEAQKERIKQMVESWPDWKKDVLLTKFSGAIKKKKEEVVITVSISINDQAIVTRSACRNQDLGDGDEDGFYQYDVDDGTVITHNREDGAIQLAIGMLKGVFDLDSSIRKKRNQENEKTGYRKTVRHLRKEAAAEKEAEGD